MKVDKSCIYRIFSGKFDTKPPCPSRERNVFFGDYVRWFGIFEKKRREEEKRRWLLGLVIFQPAPLLAGAGTCFIFA